MSESITKPEARIPTHELLPFLLEVGCEEIPARFLAQAQKDLGEAVKVILEESRLAIPGVEAVRQPLPKNESPTLSHGERVARQGETGEGSTNLETPTSRPETQVQTYSTPRRLIAYVPGILARQPDKTEEVMGPPVKVAVDAGGKFTRAAESFAQKNAASIEDLIRVTTPKGEYLALKKTTAGRPAQEVLSEVLPGIITGMSFPKSMYWEKSGVRWVRPIRWIVALLGEGIAAQTVHFQLAGVKSGNKTFGHRLAGSKGIHITGFDDFKEKLRSASVEFDPENRRQSIESEVNLLLEEWLDIIPDPELENWIVNSTEWLTGIRGEFDVQFLKLPREILVTVMRDHQKYFAVQDDQGRLRPHFIALLNRDRGATWTICAGHQRVLTARFSDAEFFWKADQKIPLHDRMAMLERVTYQAELGTYADKVRRMEAIGKEIGARLEKQERLTSEDTAYALRAIHLCKCDLTTQMVQEFTELQGIVGGLYAKAQGEPQEVADAIYDHYLPAGAEDKCPRSLVGAVVSLADKIDSLAAGFAVGLAPTGSSDPFGLRRAGNGIVKVLLESQLKLPLTDLLLETGFQPFASKSQLTEGKIESLLQAFLAERIQYHFEGVLGFPYDAVRAVTRKASVDHPADALLRLQAVQSIRSTENMQALSHAAKRIKNILAKSAGDSSWEPGLVDDQLLKETPEIELEKTSRSVEHIATGLGEEGKYVEALSAIATLRSHVDLFFDKVLVMAEDKAVRQNRLRLLARLDELFSSIADLSQIESSTLSFVGASTEADDSDE
ncbi:MAG TPA: glycine--tRNA ligase subunit beta [Terriglobia bacterium]|nr:glycine--tRNA ligase subunit beta [Terriglobia bacterium]